MNDKMKGLVLVDFVESMMVIIGVVNVVKISRNGRLGYTRYDF